VQSYLSADPDDVSAMVDRRYKTAEVCPLQTPLVFLQLIATHVVCIRQIPVLDLLHGIMHRVQSNRSNGFWPLRVMPQAPPKATSQPTTFAASQSPKRGTTATDQPFVFYVDNHQRCDWPIARVFGAALSIGLIVVGVWVLFYPA
jgi:hypothetical protein